MAKKSLFFTQTPVFGQDMFFTQKRVAEIGGNPTPSLRGKTLHYRIWSTKDGGGGNVVPIELILHKGGMNSKNVISKFLQFETMAFLHFVATLFDRLLLQDPCWFWSGLWIKRWTLIISFNHVVPTWWKQNSSRWRNGWPKRSSQAHFWRQLWSSSWPDRLFKQLLCGCLWAV